MNETHSEASAGHCKYSGGRHLLLTQSVNVDAVCKTAPATQGSLHSFTFQQQQEFWTLKRFPEVGIVHMCTCNVK